MRNGLNFTDNHDATVVDLEIPHDTDQIINTNNKLPFHIIPTRVISSGETITIRDFGWRINEQSETIVKLSYGNSTDSQEVRLIILYS